MPQLELLEHVEDSGRATTLEEAALMPLFPALVTLLDRIASDAARAADVIEWGCPVPAFGDPTVSQVASLGLNPSNREFVDESGVELRGAARRFETLASLGLTAWDDAHAVHLSNILASCRDYFVGNPYDRWFRRLNDVVSATGASYYNAHAPACHLDLIPYATSRKWTALSVQQRAGLLRLSGDTLALLLRRSAVRVLILNGQAVVTHFENVTGVRLLRMVMPEWSLPRGSTDPVPGYAYQGRTTVMSGYPLPQEILVLGYNHNLQSSFGVTTAVVQAIRQWIGAVTSDALSTHGNDSP